MNEIYIKIEDSEKIQQFLEFYKKVTLVTYKDPFISIEQLIDMSYEIADEKDRIIEEKKEIINDSKDDNKYDSYYDC